MTVIDLGLLRDDVAPEPPGGLPRAAGRPLRIAVVLAFALLVLAGAAPAIPRMAFVVPAQPGASALLRGDQLYLLEPGDAPIADSRLSAWTIPASGKARPTVRWQVVVPVKIGSADGISMMQATADLLLLSGASRGPVQTFAFERGTGRLRWQQTGSGTPAGRDLLFTEYGAEGQQVVRSVDPETGRARWSAAMSPGMTGYRYAADGVDRIVVAPPRAPVEVWDARRGVRLHTAQIDWGASGTGLQIVGDLLLVNTDRLAGYDFDRLDRRWDVTLTESSSITSCGLLICATGQTGGVRALDPATGRTVWHDTRWGLVGPTRGSRMLADSHGGIWQPLVVLDTATGRTVADLGIWQLVPATTVDGPLVGVRPAGGGRMLAAEIDVAAARVRVLDALPAVSGKCRADGELLLCRLVDGAFGVWRLPR
ncbi:PQQ-binding-like beta-propeller repeat protein [Micromonospora sp. NPDC051925]|uniref:outer membrane protein assembly factor BamB family protein n=1 Tax=Micromonospora sp. NPDC051925 TaxID=3364288 RepID=UPI0037C7F3B6